MSKEKKEEVVEKKKVQVYVRSGEKVERRKKEGWKVVPLPNDRMGKLIRNSGNDLTLMEKEI